MYKLAEVIELVKLKYKLTDRDTETLFYIASAPSFQIQDIALKLNVTTKSANQRVKMVRTRMGVSHTHDLLLLLVQIQKGILEDLEAKSKSGLSDVS